MQPDRIAQHQAAFVEVAVGHVSHRQFKQGHIISGDGSFRCHPAHCLADGACYTPND